MKKLLVFCLLFSFFEANAQFFAGVEASLGSANLVSIKNTKAKSAYSVGINVGYEILKHIPVTAGVQFSEFNGEITGVVTDGTKGFRVPVKVGYCHYLGHIRPFVNIGVYASLANKLVSNMNYTDYNGRPLQLSNENIKPNFGYIGQLGIGYKVIGKLLLSVSLEYTHPFKDKVSIKSKISTTTGSEDEYRFPALSFIGANVGVSWYF